MELPRAGAVAAAAVCVGGGRLAEVTATYEAASHGGDGSVDRADASCCRFVSVSGGWLAEAIELTELTVAETLWPLLLLPVCVGGGRLVEVMV